MIITQHPGELHAIYNPCIIKCTKGVEVKAKIFIAFGLVSSLPVDYITYEREYLNNQADFNLKRILQIEREYLNSVVDFDLKEVLQSAVMDGVVLADPLWIDKQFFVEYSVFDNLNNFIYSATAINAVAQIQESSNMTDQRGHFMTKFDVLKKYVGYPLEIVAFGFRSGDTCVRFDGNDFAQVDANVFVVPVNGVYRSIEIANQNYGAYLRDNQGRVITDNLGNGITWTSINTDFKDFILPIENLITPATPFYIRWVNRQGGWDYWMFGYRQYFDRGVSNQLTFNPYVEDQETAKGFTQLVSLDGAEKVKVGSSGMNQNDFDCVSLLVYSPNIEWFNESTQMWQTILIDGDGKSEDDTHDILKDLEFTFLLPTPQLQF